MKLLIITQVMDTEHPVLGFFHNWVREFASKYDSVEVICLQSGKLDLPANVRVHSLGKEEGKNKADYIFRFFKYIWQLRDSYDHVFVHMNQVYMLLGGIPWKLLGKRVGFWYAHGHMDASIKIASFFSDIVFTSTSSGFRYEIPKKTIVGQGIDTDYFICRDKKPSDVLRLVYFGRMSSIKGIDKLLKACVLLKQKNLAFKLSIIGGATTTEEEKYLESIKSFVEQKSLQNEIIFVGRVSHDKLPHYLSEADIFVNPSSTGSLDKTGVEAMSMEVIVLTCNEAYKEVLGELTQELMFEKGDVNAISEKITRFTDESLRQRVGQQLRQIVIEKHSLKRLISLMSDKLKSIK